MQRQHLSRQQECELLALLGTLMQITSAHQLLLRATSSTGDRVRPVQVDNVCDLWYLP